jgi:hypothetical protein
MADYWWIGYALAIFAGVILSVFGLWARRKRDQQRDSANI